MSSDLNPHIDPFPVRANGWVQNQYNGQIAQIRAVYRDTPGGVTLMDLWLYDFDGTRLGRMSPNSAVVPGPRTYEPAICYDCYWRRIEKPTFPVENMWNGETYSQMLPVLPDGKYLPRGPRKVGVVHRLKGAGSDLRDVSMLAAEELEATLARKPLSDSAKASIRLRIAELRAIAARET